MVDYQSLKAHFESNNLSYYTFYPKSERPIKTSICYLPIETPAEDIAKGLVDLGFEVISIRHVNPHWSLEGTAPITLPLFFVTLPITTESQDLFKLSNLCHISIKVESYKSKNALTQCYNCQNFGHFCANCKRPHRCLWCVGSHLCRYCTENRNATSTQACCNCQLAEGETAHPANYCSCRYAKEEMQKKKPQGTPKNTTGRVFSSNLMKPSVSFVAALRGHTGQKIHQEAAASASASASASVHKPSKIKQQKQVSQFRLPVQTLSL
jgi:hypothetical protein